MTHHRPSVEDQPQPGEWTNHIFEIPPAAGLGALHTLYADVANDECIERARGERNGRNDRHEEGEVDDTTPWDRDGPLVRAIFDGANGFVTYRTLEGYDGPADGARLDVLISRTIAYFRDQTTSVEFEWKSRAHDRPADLVDRLQAHGLVPRDIETVITDDGSALLS